MVTCLLEMLRSSRDLSSSADSPVNLDSLTIVELVNHLHQTKSLPQMCDWFFNKGFVIRKMPMFIGSCLENKVIVIFYRDFTQLWTTWARQSRGVTLYLDLATNSWKLLKFAMPRGAEALTGFHIKNKITSTENIIGGNFGIFDQNQQMVMQKLRTPYASMHGYLTMKVDGMMVCVTLYKGTLGRVIREIIMNRDDDMAKKILQLADINNCGFVPVISTQRTFNVMETGPTFSYIATALLVATGAISHIALTIEVLVKKISPIDAFMKYGDKFMNALKIFNENVNVEGGEFMTLSFEAVCQSRKCAWGHTHTELAIDYPKTFVNLLSFGMGLTTTPHFRFSDVIHKMGFDEPLWWEVDSSNRINEMLADLSCLIMNQMSEKDYLAKYKSSNRFQTLNRIDREGFIFWADLGDGQLDYHKLKSREYYISHKPKEFPELFELAKKSHAFPNANNIYKYFQELKGKFFRIIFIFRNALGLNPNSNPAGFLFLFQGMSKKAQETYECMMDTRKKCLMLMQTDRWETFCCNLFRQIFEPLKNITFDKEKHKFLKNIITKLEPWNEWKSLMENITRMFNHPPPFLEEFYFLLKEAEKPVGKNYVPFTKWWVFGCPWSTDIDVFCLTQSREDVSNLDGVDPSLLKKELAEFGYDTTNRELDISYGFIETDKDGNPVLSITSKGGDESQNIIFMTYEFHKQKYPQPFKNIVQIDLGLKVRIVSKYFMDNLKSLIGYAEYLKIREEKGSAYQGTWNRINFAIKYFNWIKKYDTQLWKEDMKSLTMKIIQLILLEKSQYEYTKEGLANWFEGFHPGHLNGVLWFLTRGKKGQYCEETLQILIHEFLRIAKTIPQEERIWQKVPIDVNKNSTMLPNEVFNEFIRSPETPTKTFDHEFRKICTTYEGIGDLFPLESQNCDLIPAQVRERVITADQRSPEWLEALTFYKCGNNTGVIPCPDDNWVDHYYNLIRGSIVELIVMRTVDLSSFFPDQKIQKIHIGLLVKEKGVQGSPGCAPDLLLCIEETGEIIACEIKCLASRPIDNCHYRRAEDLARRQLESCIEIINDKKICHRGMIIICYVYQDDKKKYIFDARATMIDF